MLYKLIGTNLFLFATKYFTETLLQKFQALMMSCATMGPETMNPANHELEPLNPNQSSLLKWIFSCICHIGK